MTASRHSGTTARRGFTLVELLVVIGIIAVLIGVLLPALSAARRQANTVKCLGNLRTLGQCFLLYANDHHDAFPVTRSDTPDGNPPTNQYNTYYTDMLMKYVSRYGKMNFQIQNDAEAFRQSRSSILWGCPQWDGWTGTGTTYIDGRSIFEAGYAMNIYPTCEANHPSSPVRMPPGSETQMRTTVLTAPDGSAMAGHFYKRAQWTHSAERLLMCDANLWVLLFNATDTTHKIPAQTAVRAAQDNLPGGNQIDRYRHGKYPLVVNGLYSLSGGQQKFNVVFADGHAATLLDIKDGYRAVRMRDP
jgi:prepilin-type N-terminal cleavage/methylation domain-containing protein/prepilin-type processing-associated H-X9-DG protein